MNESKPSPRTIFCIGSAREVPAVAASTSGASAGGTDTKGGRIEGTGSMRTSISIS
jgi:hypothetical protein